MNFKENLLRYIRGLYVFKTTTHIHRKKMAAKVVRRKEDWRKKGWAKAAEAGLYAASRFHPVASLAYDGVGKVTGFNTEKKYFDISGSPGLINGFLNGGTGTILTNIGEGLNGNDRAGISVKLTDFQIRIIISPIFPTVATDTSYLRLAIVYDREGNVTPTTPPGVGDLWQDTTTTVSRMITPLNVQNFGRFQVLRDEIFKYSSGADNSGLIVDWTWGQETLKEHHLIWSDQAGADDPIRGHIYLMALSVVFTNNALGAVTTDTTTAKQPVITYWARSRFVDN